jgi:adenosine/AMP kinase
LVEIKTVSLENPEGKYQLIVGQGNFTVFTCDDLFRSLLTCVPGIKCAVAMNEAVPKLTRVTGNDGTCKQIAEKNALNIAAGHVFVIVSDNAFPINLLRAVKDHPAVASVFVATANPVEVLVAETGLGHSVLGCVDGASATAVEDEDQKRERRRFAEKLGYGLD